VPVGARRKSLERALHNALRADVDPRTRRHLAVHHQPAALEFVEVLPVRPAAHQIRVRDEHPRRVFVGSEDADRPAALHQQRLVVGEALERAHNGVERGPISRGLAGSAVNDEVIGTLGDRGIDDPVNLEIDVLAKYVERLMPPHLVPDRSP